MLKIKDNVDLKELEKFGFEDSKTSQNVPYEYWGYGYEKDYHFNNTYFVFIASGRRGQDYYLLVNKETRKLVIYATTPDGDGTSGDLENVIYDLIQADLVEKV
jgi:hypothetical protein